MAACSVHDEASNPALPIKNLTRQYQMELVSSPWHVISTLLVFLAGAVVAVTINKSFQTRARRSLLLYGWHTAFCVSYAIYTLSNIADAEGYYRAALGGDISFSFGSAAVELLTFFCVSVLGLSYLGSFFFYNILGFVGLIAFDASLRVATANKSRVLRLLATLIAFLPSVSFWSSAIGKDAISFMGTGLALWAALRLKRRVWLMMTAVILMLMVRPHVAGIMILALAGSQIVQRGITLSQRLMMGGAAALAAVLMVPLAMNYSGVGSGANAEELVSYIEQRQQENQEGGSSIDIASMNPPMQLFTYLFRPVPLEAHSLFSLASSIDNVILLLLFVAALCRAPRWPRQPLEGDRAFMWFYSILAWVLLASTTSNMGIAVRQKWMFVPMLIFLLLSLMGRRKPGKSRHIAY